MTWRKPIVKKREKEEVEEKLKIRVSEKKIRRLKD